jgi:hypothetical protein
MKGPILPLELAVEELYTKRQCVSVRSMSSRTPVDSRSSIICAIAFASVSLLRLHLMRAQQAVTGDSEYDRSAGLLSLFPPIQAVFSP